eukprot:3872431-Pyramimonas_sp.AAC.1
MAAVHAVLGNVESQVPAARMDEAIPEPSAEPGTPLGGEPAFGEKEEDDEYDDEEMSEEELLEELADADDDAGALAVARRLQRSRKLGACGSARRLR